MGLNACQNNCLSLQHCRNPVLRATNTGSTNAIDFKKPMIVNQTLKVESQVNIVGLIM